VSYIENALVAPAAALFRENGSFSAFLVKGDQVRKVKVEVGARTSDWAEVKSGVSLGDVLVLYPSDQVVDGVKVAE
jgi:HlyD family secretion protein